jgi:hypothetical protein
LKKSEYKKIKSKNRNNNDKVVGEIVVPAPNRSKALRLISMANELLAIARELDVQESPENGESQPADEPQDGQGATKNQDLPIWGELARQAYQNRRSRNLIFANDDLFGEPAWDILLDLFIAAKERRRISVTSACIGAAVPPTTALRWIAILENQKLLVREADPGDARRVYVTLTALGYEKMLEYFARTSVPAYPVTTSQDEEAWRTPPA